MPEIPLVTLYRDGLANLNSTATRLLPRLATSLLLLPPTASERYWLVLADASGELGNIALLGRSDRVGILRFRAHELARQVFAAVPPQQVAIRFELETLSSDFYRLLPQAVATVPKKP